MNCYSYYTLHTNNLVYQTVLFSDPSGPREGCDSYAYAWEPVPALTSDPVYPAILFTNPSRPGRGCDS